MTNKQTVEELEEKYKKVYRALERLTRSVGRVAVDSIRPVRKDLLKAYKQANDTLQQLKQE